MALISSCRSNCETTSNEKSLAIQVTATQTIRSTIYVSSRACEGSHGATCHRQRWQLSTLENQGPARVRGYDDTRLVIRDLVSIVLLVSVVVVAPLGATSPYFLITPGGTWDIASRVKVPDEVRRPAGCMA